LHQFVTVAATPALCTAADVHIVADVEDAFIAFSAAAFIAPVWNHSCPSFFCCLPLRPCLYTPYASHIDAPFALCATLPSAFNKHHAASSS